jgi:uncharacterized membrane protein YfcA
VREDHLSWRVALIGLPGVYIGAQLASRIPDEKFEMILGLLMPVLLVLILKKPKPKIDPNQSAEDAWSHLNFGQKGATLVAFLVLGMYAGFLQAGVGIMILAALGYLVRMDLVRGNYVKLVFILGLNIVALLIFYFNDVPIAWVAGLTVTAGQIVGVYFGTWVAIRKGERWILVILTLAIVLSSAKLLGLLDLLWNGVKASFS